MFKTHFSYTLIQALQNYVPLKIDIIKSCHIPCSKFVHIFPCFEVYHDCFSFLWTFFTCCSDSTSYLCVKTNHCSMLTCICRLCVRRWPGMKDRLSTSTSLTSTPAPRTSMSKLQGGYTFLCKTSSCSL